MRVHQFFRGQFVGTWESVGPHRGLPQPPTDEHVFVVAEDAAAELAAQERPERWRVFPYVAFDSVGPGSTLDAAGQYNAAPVLDYGPSVDIRAFMLLFTPQQRKAIRTAAQTDEDLMDWLALMQIPSPIQLRHPITLAGLDVLVQKGLIDITERNRIIQGIPPRLG